MDCLVSNFVEGWRWKDDLRMKSGYRSNGLKYLKSSAQDGYA